MAWPAYLEEAFLLYAYHLRGLYGDGFGDAGSHRSCLTCTLSLFCERQIQILQDGSKLKNKILGKNNFQAK
jgi:hypothetical protein